MITYDEAIEYLTRCADSNGVHWSGGTSYAPDDCPTCHGTNDAGWLRAPGSRYGWTSEHCAPVAYRHAVIVSREQGAPLTYDALDHSMSLVVNDHEGVQRDLEDYAIGLAHVDIADMVQGYLDAQLWAGLDYGHERCDDCTGGNIEPHPYDENYGSDDVAPEYVEALTAEFRALVTEHPLAVRMYVHRTDYRSVYFDCQDRSALFGHDYYLTREGHGAGFWDRGLGLLGDYLSAIAKSAGSADELWDNGNGVLAS